MMQRPRLTGAIPKRPLTPKKKPSTQPEDADHDLKSRKHAIDSAKIRRINELKTRLNKERQNLQLLEERRSKTAIRTPVNVDRQAELNKLAEANKNLIENFVEDPAIDHPEMISKLMSMEEKGMSMHNSPRDVMAMVMPEVARKELLGVSMVSDVAPQLVVPREIPTRKLNRAAIDSVVQLGANFEMPADGVASKFLKNDINNINEIFENAQATATTSKTSLVEVDVEVKGPKCANYFQMRGSHTPSWFTGFYTAYPGEYSLMQRERSPSATMLYAWRYLKPSLVKIID